MLVNNFDDVAVVQLTGIESFAYNPNSALPINLEQMILGHLEMIRRVIKSRLQKARCSQ